jgi:hypothetical protein
MMNYLSYLFYATGLSDMEKVKKSIFMFVDLFGLERYSFDTLVKHDQTNICR